MGHVRAYVNSTIEKNNIRFDRIENSYNLLNRKNITKDEFNYAFTSIASRNIYHKTPTEFPDWFNPEENCGAIAPIFDLWNHSPG